MTDVRESGVIFSFSDRFLFSSSKPFRNGPHHRFIKSLAQPKRKCGKLGTVVRSETDQILTATEPMNCGEGSAIIAMMPKPYGQWRLARLPGVFRDVASLATR
jgi:hypothetical protein